jgi:hypothetical protein
MFRISLDPSSGSNKKQYFTKITYNCSTVQVMCCQCLAACLTCNVCVYCTGWRCTVLYSTSPTGAVYTHTKVKYAAKH